jgi:hypothetical protein
MDRENLYRLNIPLIEQAYKDSQSQGIDKPIIFVIHATKGTVSASIATFFNQPEDAKCVFWVEASEDLAAMLRHGFPKAAHILFESEPPHGQFFLCVVAGDSVSVGSHPKT